MSRVNQNQPTMTPFILLSYLFISACSAEPESPYPVIDSKYATSPKYIYWLDNSRVIFIGSSDPKPQTVAEKRTIRAGIYIWDITKNEITKYRDIDKGAMLCYADGRVVYSVKVPDMEKGARYRMEGKLGEEELVVYPKRNKGYPPRKWVEMDCRYHGVPEFLEGRRWELLKKGDGFIELGPIKMGQANVDDPAVYYSSSEQNGMTLPISRRNSRNVKYYNFKQAYFIWAGFGSVERRKWKELGGTKGLWLHSNGSYEEFLIPYLEVSGKIIGNISIVKDGVFFEGGSLATLSGARTVGGYFLSSGNRVIKIISGIIETVSVSPDGCKLAFSHLPNLVAGRPGGKEQRTLKMVDMCIVKKGRKS